MATRPVDANGVSWTLKDRFFFDRLDNMYYPLDALVCRRDGWYAMVDHDGYRDETPVEYTVHPTAEQAALLAEYFSHTCMDLEERCVLWLDNYADAMDGRFYDLWLLEHEELVEKLPR